MLEILMDVGSGGEHPPGFVDDAIQWLHAGTTVTDESCRLFIVTKEARVSGHTAAEVWRHPRCVDVGVLEQ